MMWFEKLDVAMEHFTRHGGFLTAKDSRGRVNTMTLAWGFAGYLWNAPQFIAAVRPQRFTYEILKNADSFTISVPFGNLLEELIICGKQSGRDIDKSRVVTFADARAVASPVVAGCDFYYECKINYVDALNAEKIPKIVSQKHYNGDFHEFFMGEIVAAY